MKDFYVFLLGLFGITEMVVGGFRMPVAVTLLLPVLFKAYASFPHNKYTNRVIGYIGLWVLGLVVSGMYNNSPAEYLIKQVGKTACLFLYFPVAIWALKEKPLRILYFTVGLGLSGILQFFIFPVADFQAEVEEAVNVDDALEIMAAWFISPLIAALCSLLYYKGYRILTILLAVVYGFWAVFNNSRISLVIYLTFALLLILLGKPKIENVLLMKDRIKKKYKRVLLLLIVGLIGTTNIYEYLAENDFLDERSTAKYYDQKSLNDLGLATGRVDFFVSAYAVIHHPLLGYGTPAKDKEHLCARFGRIIHYYGLNWSLIPTHSHILGAWVQAGLLGVFFWMWIIKIMYVYMKEVFLYNYRMWAFSIIYLFLYSWDLFFSPYVGARGYRLAFIFSYFIILIMTRRSEIMNQAKNNKDI